MGPEINIDSILALEKQIDDGQGDVIQLKRTRNSLLNISARVPPELLGQVFRWNTIPGHDYGGLKKGSYNFLLVCHHWFEVASGTPELWTYWGNSPKLWSKRYQRSGTAPLDLVLSTNQAMAGENAIFFDQPLQNALRRRAVCNSIRSIHIVGGQMDPIINSIISLVTLDGEGVLDSSIESLRVGCANVDVSKFLARYRFPKLRELRLDSGTRISS